MEIIETTQSNCRTFIVKGKLDVLTAPMLRETIMARIEEGAAQLLINRTLLDYISSAGLRVLYEALAKLEASSGHMALCAVNSNVRRYPRLCNRSGSASTPERQTGAAIPSSGKPSHLTYHE